MRLLVTFLILANINFVYAQQSDTVSKNTSNTAVNSEFEINRKLTKADIHIKNGDYKNALSNLKEVDLLLPNKADVHYKLGLCYFNLNNDSIALSEFETAFKLGDNGIADLNYYLGVTKHLNGFYADAIGFYEKEKEKAVVNSDITYLKEIEKRILECTSGKELLSVTDTTIQLYNIGDSINSQFEESSMSFASDSLLFITSTKPSKNGFVSENIYYSIKNNGKWTKISDIGKPINTTGNDAVLGYDVNEQRLFLYAEVNGGDIYTSSKKDAIWTRPLPFSDSINSTKMESSLCLSGDKNTLYFVSNRLGSIGGKDIFYSVKKENTWTSPLNIGSVINSEYDEESPFMINDTLYFSSRGHNSVGGFDVFKTYKQNGAWVKPVNLGFPVNSPYDELSYMPFNNLKYVITDRPGGKGGTDIYEIDLIENRTEKKEPLVEELIVVTDSSDNADIVLTDTSTTNNTSNKTDVASTSIASQSIDNNKKSADEKLSALNKGEKVDLIALLNLNPILFKFDKFSLPPEAKKSVDSIINCLKQHPDLKLEISVFTDCRGSATYNKKLAEKRALVIKEYIRKKSSSVSKRTKLLSLGEKNPLIDCNCDARAKNKCSVTEHMQNRRAEVKALKK